MIKFPSLKNGKKKVKKYIHSFGGINNSNNYREGEFESCLNVDIGTLPHLGIGRAVVSENITAVDLLYDGGVSIIESQQSGTVTLYYRPEKEDSEWLSYSVTLPEGKKEIASAGGKVIVMPDKKVLDLTEEDPWWKDVEDKISYSQQAARLYGGYMVFKKEEDFNLFATSFKVGDVLNFTGGYYEGNETAKQWRNVKLIVRGISGKSDKRVTFDPYTFDDTNAHETTPCYFSKTMPALTHLCSFNDRVWGVSEDGKIYASKYQDPTNFEYFDLTSADSFTLEAGAGGAFTGSCATGNYIAFFRENKIHRITGTKPSNYRHTVIKQAGVMSGSERSLAVINDIMYYEGKGGIYAFDGTDARIVSEKLGDFVHSLGVAAVLGDEYYISIKNKTGQYEAYHYHTRKDIWVRDGVKRYISAVNFMGKLYFLDGNNKLQRISDSKSTGGFEATLKPFEADFAEKKGFMRICVGFTKKSYGYVECYVSYNDSAFKRVAVFKDGTDSVGEIRLSPNRGDSIRIKIYASYDAVVKYVMREYHTHGITL